jgi:tetratricopeptide (TPR) repeat protein
MGQRDEGAQALALLEKVVLDAPDNVAAREALFRAQAAAQQLDEARRTAEDIKLLRPEQAVGYYLAGAVADAQQRRDDAMREYERALELQPDAAEPLTALVRAEVASQRTESAIRRLNALIAKYPKNVVAKDLLGEVLIAAKRLPEAIKVLGDASAQAPQWWLPYRTIAIAYLHQGNNAAAIENYRRGLKAIPTSIELVTDLATLFERDGQYEQAIQIYEEALKHNPKLVVAANNLALLLVSYRRDQASLDRANDLATQFESSSNPAFLDTHAWVKYKRGEFAAALPILEEAAQKVPQSAVIRYHLAMAQFRTGQLEQARDNLELALKAGASFAGADEARATLDELRKKRSG